MVGAPAMNIRFNGTDGEIRIGRRVQAELASWSQGGARKLEDGRKVTTITFTVKRLDTYWANYGPPTTVALTLPRRRMVYEVESGEIRAGALIVKLPPRVETT